MTILLPSRSVSGGYNLWRWTVNAILFKCKQHCTWQQNSAPRWEQVGYKWRIYLPPIQWVLKTGSTE